MNKRAETTFGLPILLTVIYFFVIGILHCIFNGGILGITAIVFGGLSLVCGAVFLGNDL